MGGTSWSRDTYSDRVTSRALTNTPVFAYTAAIKEGTVEAKVNQFFDPQGIRIRESRDSDIHPVTIPVAVWLDVTGSMLQVPAVIEAQLPKLMGLFTGEAPSQKKYLGDGYPAILVGAIDDYKCFRQGRGSLQMGQFESGIEIDDMLEQLWLTGNGGGGEPEESYELALYMMARHTAHDHMDKRNAKGYCFLIGDEKAYPQVKASQVKDVIGDGLQEDISIKAILDEVKKSWECFFVIPGNTTHYKDRDISGFWVSLLGEANVLRLKSADQICELIVTTVATREKVVSVADLVADGLRPISFED